MVRRERREAPLSSIRPLVRYVDQDQAVIELRITLPRHPSIRGGAPPLAPVNVLIELQGPDGFNDEQRLALHPEQEHATVRFQVIHPQRWWPAGMGEQCLYTMSMSLFVDGVITESRTTSLGLTSVRQACDPSDRVRSDFPQELLVNSQICPIRSILPVDLIDERRLLPVGGQSLLIVRGHYGPDLLYESADRTGLLLIQTVPIHPEGQPEADVAAEVDRLASHPSLAGWFVGHLGAVREQVAKRIQELDPSRNVFVNIPGASAA